MELTTEHEELKRSALRFVEEEINPHVDEWEENEIFPAHDLFKKLGDQGFLGVTNCLLYTSPSPRDGLLSRMPSSA